MKDQFTRSDFTRLAMAICGEGRSLLDGMSPGAPAELGAAIKAHPGNDTHRAFLEAVAKLPDDVRDHIAVEVFRIDPLNPPPLDGKGRHEGRFTTGNGLLDTVYPPLKWVVPGLLPAGLTFLSGRPKLGKSFLTLQMVNAVGSGGYVLGKRVDRRLAVYFALEDPMRRLQERSQAQGLERNALTMFSNDLPRLDEGGLDVVREVIEDYEPGLLAIDTLSRVLPESADQNSTDRMSNALAPLQKLAVQSNTALLIVDHHRKGANGVEGDHFDATLGATGKIAVADAVWSFFRERGKPQAQLKMGGRDLEEAMHVLAFDQLTQSWQMATGAQALEVLPGQLRDVVAAVRDSGGEMTAAQAMETLGWSKPTTHRQLVKAVDMGLLTRASMNAVDGANGRTQVYRLADGSEPDPEVEE